MTDQRRWYHHDGTECVAGHDAVTGECAEGGGPVAEWRFLSDWSPVPPDLVPLIDLTEVWYFLNGSPVLRVQRRSGSVMDEQEMMTDYEDWQRRVVRRGYLFTSTGDVWKVPAEVVPLFREMYPELGRDTEDPDA